MNRQGLRELLDAEDVRDDLYRLDGVPVELSWVLGVVTGGWRVYYYERGRHEGERRFGTEDEACAYLLEMLLKDPGSRNSWRARGPQPQ